MDVNDVDRLRAELEIRSLIARLARLADTGEIEDYLAVFTDDAVLDIPGAAREGMEALRAGALAGRESGGAGPGSQTMHFLGASEVIVDGDEASAFTTFAFLRDLPASPAVASAGRYHDRFRRTPTGWKFAHRRVVLA